MSGASECRVTMRVHASRTINTVYTGIFYIKFSLLFEFILLLWLVEDIEAEAFSALWGTKWIRLSYVLIFKPNSRSWLVLTLFPLLTSSAWYNMFFGSIFDPQNQIIASYSTQVPARFRLKSPSNPTFLRKRKMAFSCWLLSLNEEIIPTLLSQKDTKGETKWISRKTRKKPPKRSTKQYWIFSISCENRMQQLFIIH